MSPTTPTPRVGAKKETSKNEVRDITTPPPRPRKRPRPHNGSDDVDDIDLLPRILLVRLTQKEIDRYSHQFNIQSKFSTPEMGVVEYSEENKIEKKDVDPSTSSWGDYNNNSKEEVEEEVAVKIEQDDWDYDAFEMDKYIYHNHNHSTNTLDNSIPTSSHAKKRKYKKRSKELFYKRRKTCARLPSSTITTTTSTTTTTPPRRGRPLGIQRPKKILTVEEVLTHQNVDIQERTPNQNQIPDPDPHHGDSFKPHHDDGFTPRLRQRPRKFQEPDASDPVKKCHPIAIEMNVVEKLDIDSIPGPPFNCSIPKCTDSFQSRHQLRVHLYEKHVVSQCPMCGEQFRNMRQHMYSWHRGYYKQYRHMFPSEMRPSKYEAIDEEEFEKLDLSSFLRLEPPFNCPIPNCSLECKSLRSLRSHCEKHVLKTCLVCQGMFRNVKQHVYKVHPEQQIDLSFSPLLQGIAIERQYPCHICSKTFINRSTLKRHLEMHDPIRKFGCPLCEKTFQTRQVRYHHMRYSHPRSLTELEKCPHPQCDKAFQTLAQLRCHRLKQHPSEEVSPIVMQKLPGSNLNQHFEAQLDIPQGIEGRSYSCHVCSKTYSDKTALNNHQETHDPIRKYGCPLCEKTFQNNKGRQHHMRYVHPRSLTELEKCSYPQCGRMFQTLGQLKNHRQRQHPKQSEVVSPIIMIQTTQEQTERNVVVFETKIESCTIEIPESIVIPLNSSIIEFDNNYILS